LIPIRAPEPKDTATDDELLQEHAAFSDPVKSKIELHGKLALLMFPLFVAESKFATIKVPSLENCAERNEGLGGCWFTARTVSILAVA